MRADVEYWLGRMRLNNITRRELNEVWQSPEQVEVFTEATRRRIEEILEGRIHVSDGRAVGGSS